GSGGRDVRGRPGARPLDHPDDDGTTAGQGVPATAAEQRSVRLYLPGAGRRCAARRRRRIRRTLARGLGVAFRRLPVPPLPGFRPGAAGARGAGGSVAGAPAGAGVMRAEEMVTALGRAALEGGVLMAMVWAACRAWPRLPSASRALLWWLACARLLVGLLPLVPLAVAVLPAPAPEARMRPAETLFA